MGKYREWRKEKLEGKSHDEQLLFLKKSPQTLVKSKKPKMEDYYENLTNFDFLAEKIKHPELGVQELIKDYDLVSELEVLEHPEYDLKRLKALKLVQGALQLSVHILAEDKTQLAGQLWGRLQCFGVPDIQVLLKQAKQSETKSKTIWLRPLTASLTRPDEPLLRTFNVHTGSVNAIAITPDYKVISGSSDKPLIVWNLKTGEIERTLDWVTNAVAITPDDQRAISNPSPVTLTWDLINRKVLTLWNLINKRVENILNRYTDSVNAVVITPDSKWAISSPSRGTLKIWNLMTEKIKSERTHTGHTDSVNAVAITLDGKQLIYSSSKYKTRTRYVNTSATTYYAQRTVFLIRKLRVWNLETETRRRPGNQQFVEYCDNLRTDIKPNSLNQHTNSVNAVAITPDGTRVISGSSDKTLTVWNLRTGKIERTLTGHTDSVNAVAITPDSRRVISGSSDKTLRVWDLKSGNTLFTLTGHTDSVNAVAITPDGRRLISGSSDNTFKVWKLKAPMP